MLSHTKSYHSLSHRSVLLPLKLIEKLSLTSGMQSLGPNFVSVQLMSIFHKFFFSLLCHLFNFFPYFEFDSCFLNFHFSSVSLFSYDFDSAHVSLLLHLLSYLLIFLSYLMLSICLVFLLALPSSPPSPNLFLIALSPCFFTSIFSFSHFLVRSLSICLISFSTQPAAIFSLYFTENTSRSSSFLEVSQEASIF